MSEDNVIRPTFGMPRAKPPGPPAVDGPPDSVGELLRAFGAAAGHRVELVHDPSAPEGDVFRVVIGPETEARVETVAILPATPEGEADADRIGFAILRALEVVEDNLRGDA